MSKVEEDCPVCYEKLKNVEPLSCGHIVHLSCVKKHFKPECPLCRKSLDIKVNGTRPEVFIPFEHVEEVKENRNDFDIDFSEEEDYYSDEEGRRWRKKGFNYPEEDEEWDEENPFGDDYNYGSY